MNTILQAVEKWARETPESIAFVGLDHSGAPLSFCYQKLLESIHDTAEQLQAMNAKSIALRADNSWSWIVVDLAAMYADVVLVPVPAFFSVSQVKHILKSSAVDLLLGDWSVNEGSHVGEQLNTVAGLAVYQHNTAQCSNYLPGTQKITFTSGSTGSPKGVCLSKENLCRVAQSLASCVQGEANRHLSVLPLSTLLENITGVYVPLLLGVTSYVVSCAQTGLTGSNQFDPARFANALGLYRPQSLVLTPALMLALISIVRQQPDLAKQLKFVAVGGARVSASLIQTARQLGINAYEGYGLSECGSVVCLNTSGANKAGTSGRVLPHLTVRIAPDGELEVKGNTALGYLGEPFTEEWLATGDLAELDKEGFVTLLGRKKNLIITAYGRNVSPEWVESEAFAFLPNFPFFVVGNDQQALCAVTEQCSDLAQKVTELNHRLPDYARIGTLLVLESISPLSQWFTANGKIRRSQLERDTTSLLTSQQTNLWFQGQRVTRIEIASEPSFASKENNMTPFFNQLQRHTAPAQQAMLSAPVIAEVQRGNINKDMYIAFLTQAYHHVKHTVPLLMACGGRLSSEYEWVRNAIAEYIEEEKGHQEWILNDISACGGDAEQVRNNLEEGRVGQAIELMVAYLYHNIDRHNPLALFGMVWVLEGTSVGIGGKMASIIQNSLELPPEAMTYLVSHSVLDQSHLQFFEQLMNKITDPRDQKAIIDSANIVFDLYGQMLRSLPIQTAQQVA